MDENDRKTQIFLEFENLSKLFVKYDLNPSDFLQSFKCRDYPEVEQVLTSTFFLFDDSLVDIEITSDLLIIFDAFCGGDTIDAETCKKRIKMIVALENYISLNKDDLLDLSLWRRSPILDKYPEIEKFLDSDGLFDISEAEILGNDTERLRYKKDVIFYHPYLNYHFLKLLLDFIETRTNCTKRVALDSRRMLPYKKYPVRLLEAYWYGPKFKLDNVDSLIYGIELTVHSRPVDSIRNFFRTKLDRTEFMWSSQDNLKTLQIEEIVPFDPGNSHRILVRYIHTIRDISKHQFVHLDGAIRWYEVDNYDLRIKSKLSDHPNANGYFKLFRIDGQIQDQDWVDLIANFFSGNEMIHEYFGQPMNP